MATATRALFAKTICEEEFTNEFNQCVKFINRYRAQMRRSPLFADDSVSAAEDDILLQVVSP